MDKTTAQPSRSPSRPTRIRRDLIARPSAFENKTSTDEIAGSTANPYEQEKTKNSTPREVTIAKPFYRKSYLEIAKMNKSHLEPFLEPIRVKMTAGKR